jgi:hypothetical protein
MEQYHSIISQSHLVQHFLPYLLEHGVLYAKFKTVKARTATAGEQVVTITADGIETTNTAHEGDMVVQNETAAGEQYIIQKEKFASRYTPGEQLESLWRRYQPIGKVVAMEVGPHMLQAMGWSAEFDIEAPWGEPMKVRTGDYLVTPPGDAQVYRIAAQEFAETYKLETD